MAIVKKHKRRTGKGRTTTVKRHGRKIRKKMGFKHDYGFSDVASKDIKTIRMRPKDFLNITFSEAKGKHIRSGEDIPYKDIDDYEKKVLTKKNIDWLKQAIKKDKDISIPFLEFDKWGRPVSHEGRHTSKAAEELGMETIPVTIEKRRYSRDWESVPSKEIIVDDNILGWKPIERYEEYEGEQPVPERFVYKK